MIKRFLNCGWIFLFDKFKYIFQYFCSFGGLCKSLTIEKAYFLYYLYKSTWRGGKFCGMLYGYDRFKETLVLSTLSSALCVLRQFRESKCDSKGFGQTEIIFFLSIRTTSHTVTACLFDKRSLYILGYSFIPLLAFIAPPQLNFVVKILGFWFCFIHFKYFLLSTTVSESF